MSAEKFIDESKTYKPEAIKALKAFKKKKTFKLPMEERIEAMRELVASLAEIYEVSKPIEFRAENLDGSSSGLSHVKVREDRFILVMQGRLSVITLLHEFAHCRGYDEIEAKIWSLNFFRKAYPKQFARLVITEDGFAHREGEEPPTRDPRETLIRNLFGINFIER
jgi:hypothetical protein